jgi:hypothetical protein
MILAKTNSRDSLIEKSEKYYENKSNKIRDLIDYVNDLDTVVDAGFNKTL